MLIRSDNAQATFFSSPLLATQAAVPNAAPPKPSALGDLPEWDLTHLYPALDSPELKKDLDEVDAESEDFAKTYKGKLGELARGKDGAKALFDALKRYEALSDLSGKVMSYAGLVYAGNTQDQTNARFYADTQGRLTDAGSHLIFFSLELNAIEDDVLDKLIQQEPLNHFQPWFRDLRREKPHQLSDDLEKLFLEKSVTGWAAWKRLFDETVANMRFKVRGDEMGIESALNKFQDSDETLREEAAQEISSVVKSNIKTFALIMNTLVKDKDISNKWRGFKDIADARHLANDVEAEVVEALVDAVHDAYPRLSHRYYALKAKWFGKDHLNYWDRNAPLPKVDQRTIPWEEARDTVLEAYAGFDPRMAEIAGQFFDKRWIDAPIRNGKMPGAFAHSTVPSVHPYVLINYQGKPRDVMTLAHELGHGVHQWLANPQGPLMTGTPLTLAETASVFGEMLTFRKLLAATKDASQRKALLASKVEDMINTVVRQIAFYTFERKVHLERKKGEIPAERINELWMSVQGESLGPAIKLNDGYEVYWAYISHFINSPFYVYAYAFGDCLVNSLYGVYEKANDGFSERYFDLLRAGGTKHHSELLKPFGLDAHDPAFWQIGLKMIDGMITELEGME